MIALITTSAIGILISVLGVINMRGNISTLHWYHRQRVTQENIKPFGRLVGAGTLTVGLSCLLYGILFYISELTELLLITAIAAVLLIIGIAVGLIISFYAMKKYNGGIF